jgi:hypothetical protein
MAFRERAFVLFKLIPRRSASRGTGPAGAFAGQP